MSNLSHIKHLGISYSQPQVTINPIHLPYCLTEQYQGIVARIQSNNDPHRGKDKETGIWDETHRCKD